MKIVSGGQTGVDRAALDVALKNGIACGGWCPAGRLDEFGRIPERYPVTELPNAGSRERTLRNVNDSDATVIMYSGQLGGGTEYTLKCCLAHHRPHLTIDANTASAAEAGQLIREFVSGNRFEIINIAGPRQTDWVEGYAYAFAALDTFVREILK